VENQQNQTTDDQSNKFNNENFNQQHMPMPIELAGY
jgi:hypothetical protein